MMTWLKTYRADLGIGLAVLLVSLGLSGFLLSGQVLDTSYSDWIYHAFRAQSLAQHGLVSWDAIWDNGIAYWRGYQFVPAAITAAVSQLGGVSITRAMVLLTVVLFALFHLGVYTCLRAVGRSRYAATLVTAVSFMFPAYWLITKDYSLNFAAVLVAPMLALWYRSARHRAWRVVFAALIGASVYVHPLLAVCFGGLWLAEKILRRSDLRPWWLAAEALVIAGPAIFYAWTLVGLDAGMAAPYQLSKDFIYRVAVSFVPGTIYYALAAIALIAVVLGGSRFASRTKVLFWFSAVLALVVFINLKTPLLDAANRFQFSRTLFFLVVALMFVTAELIDRTASRLPRAGRGLVLAVVIGLGLGQALGDTATYAPAAVASLPDPVKAFTDRPSRMPTGSIFIFNSIVSSYNQPTLRFSNGYNDQLLPQLVNDRLATLLTDTSPLAGAAGSRLDRITAYVKVLGIEYVFLPASARTVTALQTVGFQRAATLNRDGYNLVVLKAPGAPRYATPLTDGQAAELSAAAVIGDKPGSAAYADALDAAVMRASVYTSAANAASVSFAAPDRLTVAVPSGTRHLYLAQSYSRHWRVSSGAVIARTPEGFMHLTVPAGVSSVTLTHGWGAVLYAQLAGLVAVAGVIIIAFIAHRRHNERPHS